MTLLSISFSPLKNCCCKVTLESLKHLFVVFPPHADSLELGTPVPLPYSSRCRLPFLSIYPNSKQKKHNKEAGKPCLKKQGCTYLWKTIGNFSLCFYLLITFVVAFQKIKGKLSRTCCKRQAPSSV